MKQHCNNCQTYTNHEVLAQIERDHEFVGDFDLGNTHQYMKTKYSIIECSGCEGVSFLLESGQFFSKKDGIERSPPAFEAQQKLTYPPRLFRPPPLWFQKIPDKALRDLLYEVYESLQNNSRRLALMGARTIIDRVITKGVGDCKKPFSDKIEEFSEQRRLSIQSRDAIKAIYNAGNEAIHRGFDPPDSIFNVLIQALEHILHEVYELPKITQTIEDGTPMRKGWKPPKPQSPSWKA